MVAESECSAARGRPRATRDTLSKRAICSGLRAGVVRRRRRSASSGLRAAPAPAATRADDLLRRGARAQPAHAAVDLQMIRTPRQRNIVERMNHRSQAELARASRSSGRKSAMTRIRARDPGLPQRDAFLDVRDRQPRRAFGFSTRETSTAPCRYASAFTTGMISAAVRQPRAPRGSWRGCGPERDFDPAPS